MSDTLVIRGSTLPEVGVFDPCLELPVDIGLPFNYALDCLPFVPDLEDLWTDPFPEPGWVDPLPEDWFELDDPRVRINLEERLGGFGDGIDSGVVTEDPTIYIRTGYDPGNPSDTVDAFVQTKDGTRFPLLVVPEANALEDPISVSRAELPWLDATATAKLDAQGLGSLKVAAATPPTMMAGVLGTDVVRAGKLVNDLRSTLKTDFQEGYLGLPGMNRAMYGVLKPTYATVDDLAAAGAANIATALEDIPGGATINWGSFTSDLIFELDDFVSPEINNVGPGGFVNNNPILADLSEDDVNNILTALAEGEVNTIADLANIAPERATILISENNIDEATVNALVTWAATRRIFGEEVASHVNTDSVNQAWSIAEISNLTPETFSTFTAALDEGDTLIAAPLAERAIGAAEFMFNAQPRVEGRVVEE